MCCCWEEQLKLQMGLTMLRQIWARQLQGEQRMRVEMWRTAAKAAMLTTSALVQVNSACVLRRGLMRFLKLVEAATSSTLSIDDMAAATMATVRKSVAQTGKTFGSFSKVGTIRSVSVIP